MNLLLSYDCCSKYPSTYIAGRGDICLLIVEQITCPLFLTRHGLEIIFPPPLSPPSCKKMPLMIWGNARWGKYMWDLLQAGFKVGFWCWNYIFKPKRRRETFVLSKSRSKTYWDGYMYDIHKDRIGIQYISYMYTLYICMWYTYTQISGHIHCSIFA